MLCALGHAGKVPRASSLRALYRPIVLTGHLPQRTPICISPFSPQRQQQRGAKRKATFKLDELPQGLLEPKQPYEEVNELPQYPTVLQGAKNNMSKFKDCVLLTRVGSFYEVMQYH